jgi:tetratricopeptide (TPR) repeat protein
VSGLMFRSALRRKRRLIVLSALVAGLIALGGGFVLVRARWDREREREARAAVAEGRDALLRGRPTRALVAVASVPEHGPWEADRLTVQGLALAALDRPEAARPVLERALKLDPKQPMAAKVLAAVYFSANESDRGFEMLEKAARVDPDDFRPWFAAGDILLHFQNEPEKAAKAFRQALRRRPDHDESRVGLIDALLTLGSTSEASPLLDQILHDHPGDLKVLRLAARRARLAGQPDEMNRYAELALDLDPDDTETLVIRAQYLQMKGRAREALDFSERAVAIAPNNLSALNQLARIEAALGLKDRSAATSARHRAARDRAERIGRLKEEIQKRPDDPEPRWRIGQEAAQGGMRILAVNSFRAALALDPQCQPARAGLTALDVPVTLPPLPLSIAGPAPTSQPISEPSNARAPSP